MTDPRIAIVREWGRLLLGDPGCTDDECGSAELLAKLDSARPEPTSIPPSGALGLAREIQAQLELAAHLGGGAHLLPPIEEKARALVAMLERREA